ncbi:hypothetical protein [Thermovibrio ammonificans]|jgi:hypothetical protein
MNFGDLGKLAGALGGGSELNAETVLKLLKGLLNQPEKGKEIVGTVEQETSADSNPLEVVMKLYSYAKKAGIL